MTLLSSPKSIIVKVCKNFSGYVSDVTHNQKIQKIVKKVTSYSKSRNLVFTFN